MATKAGARTKNVGIVVTKSSGEADAEEEPVCVICCELFDGVKRLAAVGPCNHPGVCSLCYLRLRKLFRERTCVLCKSEMEQVMVCPVSELVAFEDFHIWGNDAGPGYVWDEESRMFLPTAYRDDYVSKLERAICGQEKCTAQMETLEGLEVHLRNKHKLHLCRICLKDKKVFLLEQERFTREELQIHIQTGDPRHGFFGHPRCEFCRTRFYDKVHLFEHLTKQHYTCHLCEARGIQHKYFSDYNYLEGHFRASHFLCEDPACLAKKFTVFDSKLDLQGHTLAVHPGAPITRKVEVNFTIRRTGFDGSGFDQEPDSRRGGRGGGQRETSPAPGGTDENVHEWTVATPTVAEVAAEQGEDFPALSEGPARTMAVWARARHPLLHSPPENGPAEAFPSLANRALGSARTGRTDFRAAVSGPNATAAMIANADDSDPWSYPALPENDNSNTASNARGGRGARSPEPPMYIGNFVVKDKRKKNKPGGAKPSSAPSQPTVTPSATSAMASSTNGANTQTNTSMNTSTNTSNSSTSVPTKSPSPPPPAVLSELRELLGEGGFTQMQYTSGCYRSGTLEPNGYFSAVRSALPADRFLPIFEALTSLVTDESRRKPLEHIIAQEKERIQEETAIKESLHAQSVPPPPPPTIQRKGQEEFPGLGAVPAGERAGAVPQRKKTPSVNQPPAGKKPTPTGGGGTWQGAINTTRRGGGMGGQGSGMSVVKLDSETARAATAKLSVGKPSPQKLWGRGAEPPTLGQRDISSLGSGGPSLGGGGSGGGWDVPTSTSASQGESNSNEERKIGENDFPGLPRARPPPPGMEKLKWDGDSHTEIAEKAVADGAWGNTSTQSRNESNNNNSNNRKKKGSGDDIKDLAMRRR